MILHKIDVQFVITKQFLLKIYVKPVKIQFLDIPKYATNICIVH